MFDLPHSQAGAEELITSRGMADRVAFVPGSFFDVVPGGCDLYMLSHIIHDWSEEQCLTILGNCRRAMLPTSRLLIIEMVLSEGNAFHPGKMLDMTMLATTPGQERTEPEYRALLDKAHFRLTRVIPTSSAVSIVEVRRGGLGRLCQVDLVVEPQTGQHTALHTLLCRLVVAGP